MNNFLGIVGAMALEKGARIYVDRKIPRTSFPKHNVVATDLEKDVKIFLREYTKSSLL